MGFLNAASVIVYAQEASESDAINCENIADGCEQGKEHGNSKPKPVDDRDDKKNLLPITANVELPNNI
jgi:hypothetical protein